MSKKILTLVSNFTNPASNSALVSDLLAEKFTVQYYFKKNQQNKNQNYGKNALNFINIKYKKLNIFYI